MKRGFVALLDVLGFSSLVASDGKGEHLNRYLSSLKEALDVDSSDPKVDYVAFSDSIVLTTQDDSEPALQAILLRCSRALGIMLQHKIALRGAIAYGSFFRSKGPSGVFVAGRAILDAHHYEKLQDWVGIMLAPSTIERVPNLAHDCALPADKLDRGQTHEAIRKQICWSAFVQSCPAIPFHASPPSDGNGYEGFAIVPTDGVAEAEALRDSVEQSLQALARLHSIAPSPSAQAKYKHSQAWLNQIQQKWKAIASWEAVVRRKKEEESQRQCDESVTDLLSQKGIKLQ